MEENDGSDKNSKQDQEAAAVAVAEAGENAVVGTTEECVGGKPAADVAANGDADRQTCSFSEACRLLQQRAARSAATGAEMHQQSTSGGGLMDMDIDSPEHHERTASDTPLPAPGALTVGLYEPPGFLCCHAVSASSAAAKATATVGSGAAPAAGVALPSARQEQDTTADGFWRLEPDQHHDLQTPSASRCLWLEGRLKHLVGPCAVIGERNYATRVIKVRDIQQLGDSDLEDVLQKQMDLAEDRFVLYVLRSEALFKTPAVVAGTRAGGKTGSGEGSASTNALIRKPAPATSSSPHLCALNCLMLLDFFRADEVEMPRKSDRQKTAGRSRFLLIYGPLPDTQKEVHVVDAWLQAMRVLFTTSGSGGTRPREDLAPIRWVVDCPPLQLPLANTFPESRVTPEYLYPRKPLICFGAHEVLLLNHPYPLRHFSRRNLVVGHNRCVLPDRSLAAKLRLLTCSESEVEINRRCAPSSLGHDSHKEQNAEGDGLAHEKDGIVDIPAEPSSLTAIAIESTRSPQSGERDDAKQPKHASVVDVRRIVLQQLHKT